MNLRNLTLHSSLHYDPLGINTVMTWQQSETDCLGICGVMVSRDRNIVIHAHMTACYVCEYNGSGCKQFILDFSTIKDESLVWESIRCAVQYAIEIVIWAMTLAPFYMNMWLGENTITVNRLYIAVGVHLRCVSPLIHFMWMLTRACHVWRFEIVIECVAGNWFCS